MRLKIQIPEASPGPRDSRYRFERFTGMMRERKRI